MQTVIRLVLVGILGAVVWLNLPELRAVGGDAVHVILTPPFRWQSRQEMTRIAHEIQVHERDNQGALPPERTFSTWLSESFAGGPSLDAWGNQYRLVIEPEFFVVESWGPDGQADTGDELRIVRPRANPRP